MSTCEAVHEALGGAALVDLEMSCHVASAGGSEGKMHRVGPNFGSFKYLIVIFSEPRVLGQRCGFQVSIPSL